MMEAESFSLERLAAILAESRTPVSPLEAEGLAAFLALLLKWNARINLTAIREPEEIVRRHFADSVFCARQIPISAHTLLDFGSGGGFPGIPIALLRPELSVTLAESQSKKSSFLREAVRTLELRAEAWARRVEQIPAGRCFDCITLRAVDRMVEACRTAAERVAPEGSLLIYSTERLRATVQAALPAWEWATPLHLPHAERGLLLRAHR